MKIALPSMVRPMLEDRLRKDVEPVWIGSAQQAVAMIGDTDAAWLDLRNINLIGDIVRSGRRLKWLFTIAAGVDYFDLAALREHGVILTNGSGLNTAAVADYAVMGILVAAKRYDEVVRLTDRHEWSTRAPGMGELTGSRALIIGYGSIGRAIGTRLAAFDVEITGTTRSGRDDTLAGDAWRARLGDYDWVILAAPSTGATKAMIGAAELAAMKRSAWLINIARGGLVDQAALIAALHGGEIGGAFLDTVSPEPLPPGDPLWSAPNCLQSMHLSGRSQSSMWVKSVDLFLENLDAFIEGRPMRNIVDLDAGY